MKEAYRQRIEFSYIDTSSYRCVLYGMRPYLICPLHQRLHLPKAFYNKGPLISKQTPVEAELLAFFLKDYLACLHVKSNSL